MQLSQQHMPYKMPAEITDFIQRRVHVQTLYTDPPSSKCLSAFDYIYFTAPFTTPLIICF